MGTPAIYPNGDAFQWDWEVTPSDPSSGLNPTESIFPTETIRPSDNFLLATYHDASSTALWEHEYDFRPGTFIPTDYSFELPGTGAVGGADGLNPTEGILPVDSFLPLEQGGIVHHDIHYDLMS
jgi:hypothetical protein